MNIDWTWLIVGLLVGIFFGATIKGAVGSIKAKATGG
jgi:ABC-type polysaccharide/polyol phosphate export permease